MEIVGYVDALSVRPGDPLRVMVSTKSSTFDAHLVRLIHGDEHPDGPGYQEVRIPSSLEGSHPGQDQPIVTGSYVEVADDAPLEFGPDFVIHLFVQPTLIGPEGHGIIAGGDQRACGWSLRILPGGRLTFTVAANRASIEVTTIRAAEPGAWYSVACSIDSQTGTMALEATPLNAMPLGSRSVIRTPEVVSCQLDPSFRGGYAASRVVIGADWDSSRTEHRVAAAFDGKISNPAVFSRLLVPGELDRLRNGTPATLMSAPVAAWDFGRDFGSRHVFEMVGGRHGHTVNQPTRAVTGPHWSRTTTDFADAPAEFAAIHFHHDDLDDADWKPSIEWMVPDHLNSGVYAVQLETDGGLDRVPFFVRSSAPGHDAKVLFVAPTFSYLAYANEHTLENGITKTELESAGGSVDYPHRSEDVYVVEQQLHSLYDLHHDGSGVCYSSWRRPILNMRPTYLCPALSLGAGAAHQLSADLHIIGWLHAINVDYDVATDTDIHHEGANLLSHYQVVITGTHPEYISRAVLDAFEQYAGGGGRLMYLGGNGFYWLVGLDPEGGHTIEVRRCGASTRAWECDPGEWHLSTTGDLGGLWRMRGRPPQMLLGNGFTAQGLGPGRPYTRQPDSRSERAKFIFAGVEDELIGDFPNVVNLYGAAGFELDRMDHNLGSPAHTLLLARASGFSDHFHHAVDEVLMMDSAQGGRANPDVRSDMVFFEREHGGAVFSVGSIAWSGCLPYHGYDNNVSKITENVLRRFLDPEPFDLPVID